MTATMKIEDEAMDERYQKSAQALLAMTKLLFDRGVPILAGVGILIEPYADDVLANDRSVAVAVRREGEIAVGVRRAVGRLPRHVRLASLGGLGSEENGGVRDRCAVVSDPT